MDGAAIDVMGPFPMSRLLQPLRGSYGQLFREVGGSSCDARSGRPDGGTSIHSILPEEVWAPRFIHTDQGRNFE